MPAPFERLIEPLTDATIAVFLCVLGANIGSFLNVVMHRAPRGESVVRGGSRCPACGSRVRWHDNVPVIGWLLLGGRCRDCGGGISPRYPLVEAAAGLVGAVAAVEVLSGGRTFPEGRFGGWHAGADVLLVHADWQLAAVCAAHAALLLILLCWALAELDRVAVPGGWFIAAAAGLAAITTAAGGPTVGAGWPGLAEAAVGAGAGLVLGWAVPNLWLRQSLVLSGTILGWQALFTAVLIMPLAAMVRMAICRATGWRTGTGPTGCDLLVAVATQVLAWRWLVAAWPRAG